MQDFKRTMLKALLPRIILEQVNEKPAHGYAFISLIRRKHGVYFGPSTIYPLLCELENEGYVASEWVVPEYGRPHKAYRITAKGRMLLEITCKELSLLVKPQIEVKA